MSLKAFDFCEFDDDRTKASEARFGQLLRCYVFHEAQRRDPRELPCVAVCGEGVIRARGVISATRKRCQSCANWGAGGPMRTFQESKAQRKRFPHCERRSTRWKLLLGAR